VFFAFKKIKKKLSYFSTLHHKVLLLRSYLCLEKNILAQRYLL
jgi:hypothetical protein